MSRPLSWLPRLHDISRLVEGSIRSHYDRHDLQNLFELQPRAAQKLLELLPSVHIGNAKLVDRESLSAFLEQIRETEDITALLERIRRNKTPAPRRNLRSLVRRDLAQVDLASLPESIELAPGRLAVSFSTVEQLAESMLMLARILESDGDAFARAFEPEAPPRERLDSNERNEIAALLGS